MIERDAIREKRREEQVLQSRKMEAIGRLAGGVAHDFNNLLTVISGYSERLLRSLPDHDPLIPDLEEIRRAGELAAGLTRQLLAFSRGQILKPAVVDLNRVVEGIQTILGRLVGEHIAFMTDLDPELGRIKADPAQIEQVIMNLVLNARDAMPRGGKLVIGTRNAILDDEAAQGCGGLAPGAYCMVSVSDTGCGMDQETQAHLFEPFFTTKEDGKGTGLGLSTVYGTVQQSGGHITVYSETGLGSTFKVYLPRVVDPLAAAAPDPGPVRAAGRGQAAETILLVEDQELVRNFTRRILVDCGYQVIAAADGKAALEVCERHPGAIQLLVTDVVVPEINGIELFQRAAKVRPDLRVLFVSGYARSAVLDPVLDRGHAFLEKPYSLAALTGQVREILDRPRGDAA